MVTVPREITHSVEANVSPAFAWHYWTNIANWDDPPAEFALDGLFATGSRGLTRLPGQEPLHWFIREVTPPNAATIEMSLTVLHCHLSDGATVGEDRDGKHFLTVDEVAARLCVSRSWVYNHASEIGAYRLGKYLRFSWPRVFGAPGTMKGTQSNTYPFGMCPERDPQESP